MSDIDRDLLERLGRPGDPEYDIRADQDNDGFWRVFIRRPGDPVMSMFPEPAMRLADEIEKDVPDRANEIRACAEKAEQQNASSAG